MGVWDDGDGRGSGCECLAGSRFVDLPCLYEGVGVSKVVFRGGTYY